MAVTEATLWERILRPEGGAMAPETAEAILLFSFSETDRERMKALLAKAKRGSITPTEELEIDEYERVGNLLSILKAKARRVVKPPRRR